MIDRCRRAHQFGADQFEPATQSRIATATRAEKTGIQKVPTFARFGAQYSTRVRTLADPLARTRLASAAELARKIIFWVVALARGREAPSGPDSWR